MDINAAIQALIESHAALQMEVIYLALFTLALSIYKLNWKFFRVQNVALSQRLYLKQIERNETTFKDKVSIFNKQKYMHGVFLRKTFLKGVISFKEFLNNELDTVEENILMKLAIS